MGPREREGGRDGERERERFKPLWESFESFGLRWRGGERGRVGSVWYVWNQPVWFNSANLGLYGLKGVQDRENVLRTW